MLLCNSVLHTCGKRRCRDRNRRGERLYRDRGGAGQMLKQFGGNTEETPSVPASENDVEEQKTKKKEISEKSEAEKSD